MDVPDFYEEDRYNAVARFFHWVIAFLVVFMLGLGLTMGGVDFGVPRSSVYDLHKSLGLLVLFLALARLIWRFASAPPEALDTHARWERILAKAAHAFLYFAIIAMPLSGWLMSDAAGRPPTFFGMPVPRLLEHNDSLRNIFGAAHGLIAWGLIVVIGLHIAGALKHHIIDKDATLRRMAGKRLGWLKAVITFLVLDILVMAGAFVILKNSVSPAQTQAVRETTAAPMNLSSDQWRIDTENSTVKFTSSAFGTAFTGEFKTFDGVILFDPANLDDARADIIINMDQIASGDAERDTMIVNNDWFAAADFPQARFTTQTIQSLGGNDYVAIGDLSIRDVTMPVSVPFTLDFSEDTANHIARMHGQISLDRLDFGVGQGEWQATEVVPDAVSVTIDLTATQPR